MNIYITGKQQSESTFKTVFAFAGKVFDFEIPYESKTVTHKQALAKCLEQIYDYSQKHPSIYDGKPITIHQSLMHFMDFATDEQIYTLRMKLGQQWNKTPEVYGFLENGMGDRLLQLASDGKLDYQFKENDLVIAHKNICARVVSVDRKSDTIILDKYAKRGEVASKPMKQPLLELELSAFYEPMNEKEIVEFRDSLLKLMTDPQKVRKLDDPYTVFDTFNFVNDKAEQFKNHEVKEMGEYSAEKAIKRAIQICQYEPEFTVDTESEMLQIWDYSAEYAQSFYREDYCEANQIDLDELIRLIDVNDFSYVPTILDAYDYNSEKQNETHTEYEK